MFHTSLFSKGKTTLFEIQQVQVGSKHIPSIDQKIECKIQCILASIFERFWWILGAKLGPSWKQVGLKNRWKIDPKRLGRFHIALGTFQEAPERETKIFHWFWGVLGGVSPRRGHPGAGIVRPPKSRFFKTDQAPQDQHKHKGTGKHRHKGKGKDTGQVGKNTHSRCRAKRGGG